MVAVQQQLEPQANAGPSVLARAIEAALAKPKALSQGSHEDWIGADCPAPRVRTKCAWSISQSIHVSAVAKSDSDVVLLCLTIYSEKVESKPEATADTRAAARLQHARAAEIAETSDKCRCILQQQGQMGRARAIIFFKEKKRQRQSQWQRHITTSVQFTLPSLPCPSLPETYPPSHHQKRHTNTIVVEVGRKRESQTE